MANRPIIHQYQVSPFSAKVRRVMYYKGIDFDVVNYGLSGAGKIKKLNARGKAPILEHNGQLIADSTDIIAYLEQLHPEKPVIPTDPIEQAHAHVLEDWADESLYFYDLTMRCWPNNADLLADDLLLEDKGLFAKVLRPLIPKILNKQARTQGVGRKERTAICAEVETHFDAINKIISKTGYLVGDSLTIADISVVSMCTVLARAEEANAMMRDRPTLIDWRNNIDRLTLPADTAEHMKALI